MRSAAACASAGSVPAAMLASHHPRCSSPRTACRRPTAPRRELGRVDGLPGREVQGQAGEAEVPAARRWHPARTPPTVSLSTWAMCSSSKRVRPSVSVSRTSIQLTSPPYSHVAAKRVRWFALLDRPAGVALELVPAVDAQVTRDREEPARDALGVRARIPDVVDLGGVDLADRARPRFAGLHARLPTSRRWTALICWSTSIMPFLLLSRCAACELGGERIERRGPERAEAVEPVVDLAQRFGLHRVEPACSLRAARGEAAPRNTAGAGTPPAARCRTRASITAATAPDGCSPSASSSRMRRRTGSPRTSKASIRPDISGSLI